MSKIKIKFYDWVFTYLRVHLRFAPDVYGEKIKSKMAQMFVDFESDYKKILDSLQNHWDSSIYDWANVAKLEGIAWGFYIADRNLIDK